MVRTVPSHYFGEHHKSLGLLVEMQLFSLVGSGFLNIIYIYFKPDWLYVYVNKEHVLGDSHEKFDETGFAI